MPRLFHGGKSGKGDFRFPCPEDQEPPILRLREGNAPLQAGNENDLSIMPGTNGGNGYNNGNPMGLKINFQEENRCYYHVTTKAPNQDSSVFKAFGAERLEPLNALCFGGASRRSPALKIQWKY